MLKKINFQFLDNNCSEPFKSIDTRNYNKYNLNGKYNKNFRIYTE
jgi:hypothetical protein